MKLSNIEESVGGPCRGYYTINEEELNKTLNEELKEFKIKKEDEKAFAAEFLENRIHQFRKDLIIERDDMNTNGIDYDFE